MSSSLNYTYGPSASTSTKRLPTSIPLPFHTLSKPKVFSFTHLLRRSQQANTHLHTILPYWRACHRPTHHAKHHASTLKLRVDTVKAYHCDQKQVSVVPLPELDLEPTPGPVQLVYPEGCAPIRIDDSQAVGSPVIPDEEDCSSSSSSSSSCSSELPTSSGSSTTSLEIETPAEPLTKKATRPQLRCIIPPTGNTPACVEIERSYFSPDSEYSAVILSSVIDEYLAAPQPVRATHGATLSVPQDVKSCRPLSWGCSEVEFSDCGIEIRAPSTSPCSSPSSFPSSDSSDSEEDRFSSAPLTPQDTQLHPLRIKRKYSVAMQDDSGDDADLSDSCNEIRGIFEKRPRFERKTWSGVVQGGQPMKRPSAPAPFLYSSAKRHSISGVMGKF